MDNSFWILSLDPVSRRRKHAQHREPRTAPTEGLRRSPVQKRTCQPGHAAGPVLLIHSWLFLANYLPDVPERCQLLTSYQPLHARRHGQLLWESHLAGKLRHASLHASYRPTSHKNKVSTRRIMIALLAPTRRSQRCHNLLSTRYQRERLGPLGRMAPVQSPNPQPGSGR
jgi:hypothetical protein